MSWKKEVEQIKLRKSLAMKLGGKEKIERQHKAGRLTVRERIFYLLDKNKDADSKEKKLPKLLRDPGKWVTGKSIQICKLSVVLL